MTSFCKGSRLNRQSNGQFERVEPLTGLPSPAHAVVVLCLIATSRHPCCDSSGSALYGCHPTRLGASAPITHLLKHWKGVGSSHPQGSKVGVNLRLALRPAGSNPQGRCRLQLKTSCCQSQRNVPNISNMAWRVKEINIDSDMPSVRIDLLLIDSVQLSLKCEITRWLATGHHNFFSGSWEWYCDRTRPHVSGIGWLARGCLNFFCGSRRRHCDKGMYSARRRGLLLLKNQKVGIRLSSGCGSFSVDVPLGHWSILQWVPLHHSLDHLSYNNHSGIRGSGRNTSKESSFDRAYSRAWSVSRFSDFQEE